jgi:hypothetical protein
MISSHPAAELLCINWDLVPLKDHIFQLDKLGVLRDIRLDGEPSVSRQSNADGQVECLVHHVLVDLRFQVFNSVGGPHLEHHQMAIEHLHKNLHGQNGRRNSNLSNHSLRPIESDIGTDQSFSVDGSHFWVSIDNAAQ